MTELRMLWALTGRFSPASFTRALPTGREAVLTLPLPPPLALGPPPPSLSELRNVLRMPPSSGRFLILKETFHMLCFFAKGDVSSFWFQRETHLFRLAR